jgi:membrane-bound serine protease (ClpP class)
MTLIIALLTVGAVLMFLETFMPGMILGIAGLLSLIAGVVVGYVQFGFRPGTVILGSVLVGLIVGVCCWLKFLPESRIARLLVLRTAAAARGSLHSDLLHRSGVAISQLRPSGAAFINGKRVDVTSEGSLIDRGAPLKVVAVEGIRVVVREV